MMPEFGRMAKSLAIAIVVVVGVLALIVWAVVATVW